MLDFVKRKTKGCVYTPDFVVSEMLDFIGYRSGNISARHVMDNSCGDGAFLKAAVKIYCADFLRRSSDLQTLKKELETYVHGIEIEPEAIRQCEANLDAVALEFGLVCVDWDLRCADALTLRDFDGKMDFIVGNPPYVRIHNLKESYSSVKRFSFARVGMTDLFIVFFEVGFRMLAPQGKMTLITPSSWLISAAGTVLRDYIVRERCLVGVIDLEHFQAFSATTYSLISLFEKEKKNDCVEYFVYDADVKKRMFKERLPYASFSLGGGGRFYFSDADVLSKFKSVRLGHFDLRIPVKNGFATLADDVFIGDFDFSAGTIDVVKASTGEWRKCIFPYDTRGNALSSEQFSHCTEAFSVLRKNQKRLAEGRDVRAANEWYLFGRTQGLRDVCKNKIAVNNIVRDKSSLKINRVPAGAGVYGGLYVLTDLPVSAIKGVLQTDEFLDYVRALKNYKSGGYYAFSSKDLALFINFKLKDFSDEQSGVSQRYFEFI